MAQKKEYICFALTHNGAEEMKFKFINCKFQLRCNVLKQNRRFLLLKPLVEVLRENIEFIA